MTRDHARRARGPTGDGSRRFTRTIEDFTCEHCGRQVRGDGYTNHCPHCLYSKHVDINPGDRAADCGGLMAPIAAGIERDQNFVIHRCEKCGHMHRNRVAPQDDEAVVLKYFGRPIPFIPRSPR
jgi:rubrerythrin